MTWLNMCNHYKKDGFMKLHKTVVCIFSVICFCIASEKDSSFYELSTWGWLTLGRFQGSLPDTNDSFEADFNNQWTTNVDAGIKALFHIGKNGKVRFNLGVTTAYPVSFTTRANAEPLRRKFSPYLIDGAIEYNFKLTEKQSLFTEFGFLPVKYNPQAMNLGEYLYRSGTYPAIVNSGFELADKEKLTGLHAAYKLIFFSQGWLKTDFYFTTEMRDYPINDFSLSHILTISPFPLIEIGGGFSHAHLITLNEKLTSPGTDTTLFRRGIPANAMYCYRDSIVKGDSVTYIYKPYTFKGTKVMGRFTIDFKSLLNFSFFGKEDLKLYCEGAVLGWKNYPIWYEHQYQRSPFMFGFNFPAFKILDVLAFEGEYYPNPYLNSQQNIYISRSPVPYTGDKVSSYADWKSKTDDDWRWSVYASKKLFNHIRISGQIASDHLMRSTYMPQTMNYNEIMTRTRDWYWMTRIMYYF